MVWKEKCKMGKIEQELYEYYQSEDYPFHMPGHKQGGSYCSTPPELSGAAAGFPYDITEIDGFDNLHHAKGILKEAQQKAAELYKAKRSFFLVNGSTCGILAAISAAVRQNGMLVMARNSHKSAYHAVFLRGLRTEFLYPQETAFGICGSILPEEVEQRLRDHPEADAVYVTSPTYDGVVSDIRSIAEITHRYGKMLLVDAAHGAHFGFDASFPESPLCCGADVVVVSLHKTLPAYTQSALLLLNDDFINEEKFAARIRKFLSVYETSSPSYLFMAQIENCIDLLAHSGRELFLRLSANLSGFYGRTEKLKKIEVFSGGTLFKAEKDSEKNTKGIFIRDASKILISAAGIGLDGKQLYEKLQNEYHLRLEMYAGNYVAALTGIMDTDQAFQRLADALFQIEEEYEDHAANIPAAAADLYFPQQAVMTIAQADEYGTEDVLLENLPGRISAEYLLLYPPGIPILAPGEIILEKTVNHLAALLRRGYDVEGLVDKGGKIYGKAILSDGKKFLR